MNEEVKYGTVTGRILGIGADNADRGRVWYEDANLTVGG